MRLIRQPRLALLFAGGALNAIGSWATLIALWGFAAYKFHSGPDQIALLGFAWTAPGAVFSLVSGVPIDRFGPKVILIVSDILGMATALGMAASNSYSTLVLLAVGSGCVQAFGRPAGTSLPPRIVDDEDLLAANSLLGVADQSALIFGPLAGSLAIALSGLQAAFFFDAATFVVGIAALLPLRLRPVVASAPHEHATGGITAGFRLARGIPDVRRVLALASVNFFSWGAFIVMEPLYVRDVLHRSAAVLGYLSTAFGIGLVASTMILPRFGDRIVNLRALSVSVLVSGGAAALYLGSHDLPVAVVGVSLWGIAVAFFVSPMQTLLQRATPPETHGRVMALASMVDGFAGVVAIPISGFLVGWLGVNAAGAVVGAVLAAAGVTGLVVSSSRGYAKSWSRATAITE